jgi:peptidase M48-like protein
VTLTIRHCGAIYRGVLLLCVLTAAAQNAAAPPTLADLVKRPYLDLVQLAPSLDFPKKAIDDFRKQLEISKKEDIDGLESEKKALKTQEDDARKQLDEMNRSASIDTPEMSKRRTDLHCKLYQIDADLRDSKTERSISIPVDYDHRLTKLEIIAQWPARKRDADQAVANGKARARHWGDIDDIGFRKIGENQEADVKLGEDAVNELRAYRLLPAETDSPALRAYVSDLAHRIAGASDLKIPLRVAVLDSPEINAFGLPGGRLLVDTGLVARAANESELAGVLAHEIAHIAARHGEKLTRPTSSVPRMLLQGVTMAADAFTGGAVGTARSAAHNVLGLGVHLNLSLLGVNRETEAEAGQLATQYLWKAGYDPRAFMRFYDKMVSDPVHTQTSSFFRTHPPSVDRALISLAELEYLPRTKAKPIIDSPRFDRIHVVVEAWLKTHRAAMAQNPPECTAAASPAAK